MRRISYHVVDGLDDLAAGDLIGVDLKRGGSTVYTIHEAREGKVAPCKRHGATCQRWTLFVEREGHDSEPDIYAKVVAAYVEDRTLHRMQWDSRAPRRG